jgi:hypothetical protein
MAQQWRAQLVPDFVSFSDERAQRISLKVAAPHFKMNCLIILLMVRVDGVTSISSLKALLDFSFNSKKLVHEYKYEYLSSEGNFEILKICRNNVNFSCLYTLSEKIHLAVLGELLLCVTEYEFCILLGCSATFIFKHVSMAIHSHHVSVDHLL